MHQHQLVQTNLIMYLSEVVLEGEFRNGMLHGCGSMYWPRGQVMDSTWNRGKMEQQKRYTFADGLSYREDKWNYCTFPDRRLAQFLNKI